jgi:hypothetical protein
MLTVTAIMPVFSVRTVFGSLFSLAEQEYPVDAVILSMTPGRWRRHRGALNACLGVLGLTERTTMLPITWSPLYVGRNYNVCVQAAITDLIVLWDDATIFCRSFLRTMVEDFQRFPYETIYVSGRHLCAEVDRGKPHALTFYVRDHRRDARGWILSWGVGGGIARSSFLAVGGFNERLQGWGAMDNDFTYRVARSGLQRIIDLRLRRMHMPHALTPVVNGPVLMAHGDLADGSACYDYYSHPHRVTILDEEGVILREEEVQ